MRRITLWADGAPLESSSSRWGQVYDPATGAVQAEIPFASADEVEHIVASATAAAASWGSSSIWVL